MYVPFFRKRYPWFTFHLIWKTVGKYQINLVRLTHVLISNIQKRNF
ncbi:hypothetical protein LEP1GSC195_0288 [Leptospira wolbachii serovar Codice str. CDC]|uniref:Uncharacterized protein n=1 Tax=Leptospira wolbachii serovar Codice str. CDC TaxID=1218599 RepID=R9A5U3_9LEPT|nr:hypothetical protein LEP1GSC195_0288 [Leptospira wolbachii serovar Codice str. CDC]